MNVVDKVKVGDKPIWSISLNPSLGVAAVVCGKECQLYTYKDNKLKLIETLETPHTKTIRRVSIKPTGATSNEGQVEDQDQNEYPTLALASFDSTCSIFGSDKLGGEWEMLAVIEGHESEVKGIDWSFDTRYLVTCGRDKSIWVWETDGLNEEFECVAVLNEHSGDIKCVKWSPKSHSFISCSYDDTVKIWRQDPYNDDSFDCVASIDVGCTIWDGFWIDEDKVAVALDDGRVLQYSTRIDDNNDDVISTHNSSTLKPVEEWRLEREWRTEGGPLYAVGKCDDFLVACGAGGVAVWLGNDTENVVKTLAPSRTLKDLNSLCVDNKRGKILVGGEEGVLYLIA